MTKATFYNIWSKNLGRSSALSARASNHEWYQNNMPPFLWGSMYFDIFKQKFGQGFPPSRRGPAIRIYRNNILPFYRAICISIYPLHSDKWWYTSPPPSAMVVAHFTPPSGREGNTPPHPHPRGVTMHLAPETTMTIHSWLTDDSSPGSEMLLLHTMLPTGMLLSHTMLPTRMLLSHTMLPTRMLLSHTTLPTRMMLSHTTLPTQMLLSHTTLPPGSQMSQSCHPGLSHLRILQHTVDCTLGGAYKYTLYATSPGSHVVSLPSSPWWGTINIQ